MEKLTNHQAQQVGYLVLREDGAVLESGGELQNDEQTGSIIMGLLKITENIDENFLPANSCEKMSIIYEDKTFNVCLSNRRVFIVKIQNSSSLRLQHDADPSNSTATLMT